MKAKIGRLGSKPVSSSTCVKKTRQTPKMPKNDRITEPIRYRGATIARSSAISVSKITSSTSGTISWASRWAPSR